MTVTLKDAIAARWRELGGPEWGAPERQQPVPLGDGRGCQIGYRLVDGGTAVIIWTSDTCARMVGDRIAPAWYRAGGHLGDLGYPTSEELSTHDAVGRFQNFEGGMIVWHPTVGGFEVRGEIYSRFLGLKGPLFGYPITDELHTKDGRGRYNHFRNMQAGTELSVFWSAETGAHELCGDIRRHYAALGWEHGPLGYPTSGEILRSDEVGKYQEFERGVIDWHPRSGATHIADGGQR